MSSIQANVLYVQMFLREQGGKEQIFCEAHNSSHWLYDASMIITLRDVTRLELMPKPPMIRFYQMVNIKLR